MSNLSEPNFDLETEMLICNEYKDGLSTIKLAKKYNCKWDSTVLRILKKHQIPRRDRSNQRRLFEINEKSFENIDTQEKAYFLGLLYADGGNVRNCIYLSLQKCDALILEKMNHVIGSNKPIRFYTNSQGCEYGRLSISNKYLIDKLRLLGIVERKTYKIRFPDFLPRELHQPFVRGYFDGDGCLCIQEKRNKGLITITSNKDFCLDLKNVIESHVDINCLVQDINGKKVKRTAISGNRQILKFGDWLYNSSTIHFPRKYEKYIQLKANPISKEVKPSKQPQEFRFFQEENSPQL